LLGGTRHTARVEHDRVDERGWGGNEDLIAPGIFVPLHAVQQRFSFSLSWTAPGPVIRATATRLKAAMLRPSRLLARSDAKSSSFAASRRKATSSAWSRRSASDTSMIAGGPPSPAPSPVYNTNGPTPQPSAQRRGDTTRTRVAPRLALLPGLRTGRGGSTIAMPSVLVRDLPYDVHARLQFRAAARGQSLQPYVSAELTRLAGTPPLDEMLDRITRSRGRRVGLRLDDPACCPGWPAPAATAVRRRRTTPPPSHQARRFTAPLPVVSQPPS
jgi:hypothetical protein